MAEHIILDDLVPDDAISMADAQGHWQQLVRCKDCARIDWCQMYLKWRDPNWFCGDGTAKDE